MVSVKSVRTSDPQLPGSVRYSFDIDVGQFDLGHRLIARSITVWNDRLFFEGDTQYARPPKEARYVWFDFFLIDFDYMVHHGPDGRGDEEYVRNRVCRLTLDLVTGSAWTEK